MEIRFSEYRCAAQNLALEQELLSGSEQVLLLYINDRAVVVGRNQTIEAEVDCEFCRKHDIEVVRRESGGGAVYHDGGNLNYAIICNGGERPLDRDYTEPIVWALQRMGVEAVTGGRGEIMVDGKKVSGSASMVRRGRVLFHGTLLFDSDLDMLNAALRGDDSRRGKGIKSVHSVVGNLKSLLLGVADMQGFIDTLCLNLTEYYKQKTSGI